MVAAVSLSPPVPPPALPQRPGEQRVLMTGVPWETYVALRDAVDTPGVRMTYCEGALEIMSPLPPHEDAKTTVARLIEMYAIECDVPLYGYGSTTFRSAAKARGLEPDECYCIGHRLKDIPDIAIEFWEDDAFHLHALRASGYDEIAASEILPDLDLDAVASFVRRQDQHEAVKAFRDWLRGVRP